MGIKINIRANRSLRHYLDTNSLMRYAFSIALITLAGVIQLFFKEIFQNALFIIFYPSVFYIVWIAGLRPALLAVLLSSTASLTLFGFDYNDPKAVARTLCFAFSSTMISILMNRAYKEERNKLNEASLAFNKEAERSLEFEDLYNEAPCGYHSINKEGIIVKVNDTELKLLGYTREELIGKKIISIIPEDFKAIFEKNFDELLTKGEINNLELEIIKKDGSILHCLLSSKAEYDKNNQFRMSRTSIVDITELYQAREKLNLLSLAIEQSPSSIEITDPDGRILYVNDHFLANTGYSKDEVIGNFPRFVKSGLTPIDTFQTLWKELKSGRCWNGEIINKKKTGEFFTEDIFISPVFDNKKQIKNFVAVKHDITEKKKQEEMIIDQQKQLIQSSRLSTLGEMAAGIAHEINNPLSIIHGKAQALKKQIERGSLDPDKANEELTKIISTSDRISKIINSLKMFSADMSLENMTEVKISEIIDSSFNLCLERLKNNSIEFIVDPYTDVTILCHKNQMVQILINLFNNSLHALEGSNNKWIKLSFKLEKEKILIIVSDNGSGISAEIKHKLMQPFVTTKENGKGSGLGLSISLGIAKNHKGNLYLSPHSANTCFVLELPIKNFSFV